MSRLSTFLAFPLGDRVRILVAGALLLSLPVGFSIGSFSRIRSALLRFGDRVAPAIPGTPSPRRIVRAVTLAERGLPGSRTCLVRSLATETLLRAYGYDPEHRIGVKPTDSGIKAHSWIVYEGEVLIGDVANLSRYDVLEATERGERV